MVPRRYAAAAFVLLGVAMAIPAGAAGPSTKLVSKASNGDPAADGSDSTAISGDGTVAAFTSNSENLPQADGTNHVYARDTAAAKTFLVSRTTDGAPATEGSQNPWLSTSGRHVVFSSQATNLPEGDGSTRQIYIHDLQTRRTRLISQSSEGDPADAQSDDPSISGDGRFVAFRSSSSNLPGSESIGEGLYVHDRDTGNTVLASRASDGTPAEVYDGGHISAGGRDVVFSSVSSDLPGGDGSTERVYVRDLGESKTKLASRSTQGDLPDGNCGYPALDGDGDVAVFICTATNLPGGDGNTPLVYARELDGQGATRLASRNADGDPATDSSYDPFVAANGRAVSFYTDSDNLPGTEDAYDVYVYDVRDRRLRVISRNSDGDPADDSAESYPPSLSRDGSYGLFRTNASNLPGTGGSYTQLFMRGPLD